MEIFKKLKNNQRGSITVFVLATMLIVVGIIVTIYMTTINKNNTQIEQLNKIQEEYMQTSDNSAMDQAYDENVENVEFGPGMIAEKNEEYEDDDGDTATIPKGFEIVPGLDDVSEGLVIRDSEGNEFVWIPVKTAVASSELEGTSNKAMAVKQGNNYRGLLYNFTSDGSTVMNGCTTTTSSHREPDFWYRDNEYNKGLFTEDSIQQDYNKMIESVNKYHGFYVGRYELGLEGTKPVVKNANINKGVTTADASNPNTSMWYGLYSKCKEFAPEESEKSVVSNMIWGSQYDAMMNWMQEQGENVTSNDGLKQNDYYVTGFDTNDVIKNVFDIYGCHMDWTMESSDSSAGTRVAHGNARGFGGNPSDRVWIGYEPYNKESGNSTRITLYIK